MPPVHEFYARHEKNPPTLAVELCMTTFCVRIEGNSKSPKTWTLKEKTGWELIIGQDIPSIQVYSIACIQWQSSIQAGVTVTSGSNKINNIVHCGPHISPAWYTDVVTSSEELGASRFWYHQTASGDDEIVRSALIKAGVTLAGVSKSVRHIKDQESDVITWFVPTDSAFGKAIGFLLRNAQKDGVRIPQETFMGQQGYLLPKVNAQDPQWSGDELLKLVTKTLDTSDHTVTAKQGFSIEVTPLQNVKDEEWHATLHITMVFSVS